MYSISFLFEYSIEEIYDAYLKRQIPSSNQISYLIETNKITNSINDYDKYFDHMIKKHKITLSNHNNIISYYEHIHKNNDLPIYVKMWGDTGKTIKKINHIENKELDIMTTNVTLDNVFNIFEYIKFTQINNNRTECVINFDVEINITFTSFIENYIKKEYAKTNDEFQKSMLSILKQNEINLNK